MATSDDHLYLGEAESGWTADIVSWGRVPLGDGAVNQFTALRLSLFADPKTILVNYDEPYLVSFDGGPWRGLGTPHADYQPVRRSDTHP